MKPTGVGLLRGGEARMGSVQRMPTDLRRVGVFLLAAVALQAVYWFAIYPALFARPPIDALDRIPVTNVRVAEISAPTPAAADAAPHSPAKLMFTDCCDPAYFSLKADFVLQEVPAGGLGILHFQQVDNFIFRVNGSIIAAEGEMAFGRQTFHGQLASLSRIPAGVLRSGVNTLDYITVRHGFPYTDLMDPALGRYEAVRAWAEKRLWRRNVFPLVTGSITAVLALFAALMVFRAEDRRFAFWLFALSAAWTSWCAYSLVPVLPFGGDGRMIWYFTFNTFIPVALLGFVDAWSRKPIPWLQPAALTIWASYLVWTVWSVTSVAMPGGFDGPGYAWNFMLSGFAVAVAVRLLWHFATTQEERLVEATLISLIVAGAFMDGVGEYVGLSTVAGFLMQDTLAFFLIAVTLAFVQRNFQLFRSADSLNARLARDLAVREDELRTALAREAVFIRSEAHNEERRRIMRDMHDGLGSHLMGMLLAAQRGQANPERVAEGLQTVIDEMRMMIDSMDSVGESLGAALAIFRQRLEPRVAAAGFVFDWRQEPDLMLPDYPPRATLQVFRVLQEAVANALKHSGGGRIAITIEQGDAGGVRVVVADDGPGVPDAAPAGRGLINMRRRISEVGGAIRFESRSGGRVVLDLPAMPAPSAMSSAVASLISSQGVEP